MRSNGFNDLGIDFSAADQEFSADERWQLVRRIVESPTFQKSEKLRLFLLYITERTLRGAAAQLSEQHIGNRVFGKPAGYSPVEDSSVRANARQLRLKLHEYFDSMGRQEALVLDLPKGSYAPVFRKPDAAHPLEPVEAPPLSRPSASALPWIGVSLIALLCLLVGFWLGWSVQEPGAATSGRPDWPISEIFSSRLQTQVVVADVNYGLLSLLAGRPVPLEQYLSLDYPKTLEPPNMSERESRLISNLQRSAVTSFADTVVVAELMEAAGPYVGRVRIRPARELRMRDLAEGNFVFIGSPSSNLWVSLFAGQLNFAELKEPGQAAVFLNRKPRDGEQAIYKGVTGTGGSGDMYAAVALLPAENRQGKVLIVQGLQQEGTEAAGLFVTSTEGKRKLRAALGLGNEQEQVGVHFEVLLRSRAVAGAADETSVVSARVIP